MRKPDQITPHNWSASREDMLSFTTNPETGKTEHVVYVYRGDQPRIPVFAGPLDNARADAEAIVKGVNQLPGIISLLKEIRSWITDNDYDCGENGAIIHEKISQKLGELK